MSEKQILNALADYYQDERLIFQVIVQDTQTYIYINRQAEDEIDYPELTDNIVTAVSSIDNLDIDRVYLYSRILGEAEPDWQTVIDLTSSNTEKAIDREENNTELETNSNNNTDRYDSSVSDLSPNKDESEAINISDVPNENKDLGEASLDLGSYCFIRNQRLLSGELVSPKSNIAQLIKTFHEFEDSTKEQQLPLLANYFQDSHSPNTEDLSPEIKSWWDEVLELNSSECRKTAIWLSRYCFNTEETLETIESVFSAEKAIEESKQTTVEAAENIDPVTESELRSPTEYTYTPQKSDRISQSNTKSAGRKTRKQKVESTSHKPLKINLLLPIIWLAITLSLVIADLNQPTNALPVACENLVDENLDYCLLAAKMVGEEPLNAVINNLPEALKKEESLVPEAMMRDGAINCELHGNIAAGIPLKEATPFKTPVLSSSTKEVIPDFYVADVEQTNLKEGDPIVRTACFFHRIEKIGKPYSIQFLVYDRVDVGWPDVAYEPTEKIKSVRALNNTIRTYNFFSLLGINTLFTAIAIYLLAICGMAIKVDSIETIYQASFILGMVKSILSFLPVFGIMIVVPIECLALGITSSCVPGFKIDWNYGYRFVAATAMLLIASRMLFTFLFLNFLSSMFG